MTDDGAPLRERQSRHLRKDDAPRAFSTAYVRNSGDVLVYGGLFLIVLGVLAALVNGRPEFLVLSAAGLASSFYFYPTTDHVTAQIAASSRGLYVDRIGVIPWPAIREVRLRRQALRTMQLAYLTVVVEGALDEVAERPDLALPFRLMTRNWRRTREGVEVRLHTLDEPADAILASIERFLAARG